MRERPAAQLFGKVKGVGTAACNGRFRVAVFPADRPLFVSDAAPAGVLEDLRAARAGGYPVFLSSGPEGQITAVQRANEALTRSLAGFETEARSGPRAEQIETDVGVTPEHAAELFKLILEKNKSYREPRFDNLLSGRIPFEYPDGGCQARAHEMCRLLHEAGAAPMKIWSYAASDDVYIRIQTKNHPAGFVEWDYHVAPILRVDSADNTPTFVVIDPSLFDSPVSEAVWRGVQENAEQGTPARTPPDLYDRSKDGEAIYDAELPPYSKTLWWLGFCSHQLLERVFEHGRPPY